MSERLPIDMNTLTELMRRPVIIRIVSILDITDMSILELLEYGLTLKDINYSMANGIIRYDKISRPLNNEDYEALGIHMTGDSYYNHLNSKVKLTEVGLYILESIKSNPNGSKFSSVSSVGPDPHHVSDLGSL
ncbi:MAG TPA: hypothetical protein VJ772_04370 [Nitrososphaeraceae archaeon]|nr:hypothetical protein [Nitrososphaeraceae archaeon]